MRLGLGGGLLALVAALLLAPGAEAKADAGLLPPFRSAQFEVRGSNGYQIVVEASSNKILLVSIRRRTSVLTYLVKKRAIDGNEVTGTLPGIGRIAVEFEPRGKPRFEHPWPGCKGRPERIETGAFTGTIKLRAERGFTTADRRRAWGRVTQTFPQRCKGFGDGEQGDQPQETRLVASRNTGGSQLGFHASRLGFSPQFGGDLITFTAFQVERRNALVISRISFASGSTEDFSIEPTGAPSAASVVSPPAPFAGSADFKLDPDGMPSWTGDLSVSFLGKRDPVSLAGKRFRAQLCLDERCKGDTES